MLNVVCPVDTGSKEPSRKDVPRGGWSGKKTSTTTKILLKEAAKPHHNLGERVVQVIIVRDTILFLPLNFIPSPPVSHSSLTRRRERRE